MLSGHHDSCFRLRRRRLLSLHFEIESILKVIQKRFEEVVVCLAEGDVARIDSVVNDMSFMEKGDSLEKSLHDMKDQNFIERKVVCEFFMQRPSFGVIGYDVYCLRVLLIEDLLDILDARRFHSLKYADLIHYP